MDIIKFIWKLVTNAPQIVALIKQLLDIVGLLKGDSGTDETHAVSKARETAKQLGECSGVGCPPSLLRDR